MISGAGAGTPAIVRKDLSFNVAYKYDAGASIPSK